MKNKIDDWVVRLFVKPDCAEEMKILIDREVHNAYWVGLYRGLVIAFFSSLAASVIIFNSIVP